MPTPKSRGRSTRRWRQIKEQAFRRDRDRNARCWICGQPIDYSASPGTPDAYEPDHFFTVAEHPELAEDITNLRPSHCSCNRSRGNGKAEYALGKPSRQW